MPLPRVTAEVGVVADPELKFSGAGKAWCSLRVVAKDRKKGQNGEWEDGDPMWMSVVVFGREAENLAESVLKGDLLTVTGKLEENLWTTDEGVERKDIRIVADTVGVSLRWTPAKSSRMLGEDPKTGTAKAAPKPDPFDSDPPF
jgi:single-strand DNA-binding protein